MAMLRTSSDGRQPYDAGFGHCRSLTALPERVRPVTLIDVLPADSHVHSQWSWDALAGSMEAACATASRIGLPAIAFTEHADFTRWSIPADAVAGMPEEFRRFVDNDHVFHPPAFDLASYAECIERCRTRFPELRIMSGVELGEPHWHEMESAELLAGYPFSRVVGSVHSIVKDGAALVVDRSFASYDPDDVVRTYLAEVLRMVEGSSQFSILGHIGYPLRAWPTTAGPLRPDRFEEEFRTILTALARSGRALEINTRGRPPYILLAWWRDAGGRYLTFGSDAHDPDMVGHDFRVAARLANEAGFRSGDGDLWTRR